MGRLCFLYESILLSFSIANYVSGTSSIFWELCLGTILGLVPGQFITTYFCKEAGYKEESLGALIAAAIKVYV